jgi:hypothetical protein
MSNTYTRLLLYRAHTGTITFVSTVLMCAKWNLLTFLLLKVPVIAKINNNRKKSTIILYLLIVNIEEVDKKKKNAIFMLYIFK